VVRTRSPFTVKKSRGAILRKSASCAIWCARQCNLAQLHILGLVDLAHSAAPEEAHNPEAPDQYLAVPEEVPLRGEKILQANQWFGGRHGSAFLPEQRTEFRGDLRIFRA
jgi:hypothetical protein